MSKYTQHMVILAAGSPYRGEIPTVLQDATRSCSVLDWQLNAIKRIGGTAQLVLGYDAAAVARTYPSVSAVVNKEWDITKSVGSLFQVDFPREGHVFVSYGDVLFREDVLVRLAESVECGADVSVAIDSQWLERYAHRSTDDIGSAETVKLNSNGKVVFSGERDQFMDAEFCGLACFSQKALSLLSEVRVTVEMRLRDKQLPDLFSYLIDVGMDVVGVEVQGDWAEMNAPQDLARFVLGNKAQTLERLAPVIQRAKVGDMLRIAWPEWQQSRERCVAQVMERFGSGKIVVRSSAFDEDGFSSSKAGAYLSLLDVECDDQHAVAKAIGDVFGSYADRANQDEVLIQRQLQNVAVSGVVLTRTLNAGAPYYVISYDDSSGRTDSVTSGGSYELDTIMVSRFQEKLPRDFPIFVVDLLASVNELEEVLDYDSLDIEFAITAEGDVHILQVRPIAVLGEDRCHYDDDIRKELELAGAEFERLQSCPNSGVLGEKSYFGVMPDWNPAEIIGTRPNELALSLYRYLITDDVWALQRREFGYRDIGKVPLVHSFAGHPFVDTRASFNSFLPARVSDELGTKLTQYYLNRLRANPHWHDKVEFEVLETCLAFDVDERRKILEQNGFSESEIDSLFSELRILTQSCISRYASPVSYRDSVSRLRQAWPGRDDADDAKLGRIFDELDRIRYDGTLPFAHLARAAFVAVSLLESAVVMGLIAESEKTGFLESLQTVAGDFLMAAGAVNNGELSVDELVRKYGHLRPGTYDICSARYDADVARFFSPVFDGTTSAWRPEAGNFSFSSDSKERVSSAMKALGLSGDFGEFESFLRTAIEGREFLKFEFSRNLSRVIEIIAEWAKDFGFSRQEVAMLSLTDLKAVRDGNTGADPKQWLRQVIDRRAARSKVHEAIELPPLLFADTDVWAFTMPRSMPSFIGRNWVEGRVASVDGNEMNLKKGSVAVIKNADPGYDWLFARGIAGLITAYGGANSHMAIRAAEFGLPAAIGVGEAYYQKILGYETVRLDCKNKQILQVSHQ